MELKRKNAELEQIHERHGNTVLQIQEEHSNTLRELGERVAEFESYKKRTAEEISSLTLENASLREAASPKKIGQENLQLLQEAEYTKNKVEEECARKIINEDVTSSLEEEVET